MPSEIATKAIDLLTPTIGEFLAKAKVQASCNYVGFEYRQGNRILLANLPKQNFRAYFITPSSLFELSPHAVLPWV